MSDVLTEKRVRVVLMDAWQSAMEKRFAVMQKLLGLGYQVTQAGPGAVSEADGSPMILLGEFDGDLPEVAQTDSPVHVENVREQSAETIVDRVAHVAKGMGQGQIGKWLPWFPVIDYDRCANCMQCLSFCLFGVYGVDDDKQIQVQNQDKCKTNCPACSRVCPEAAIMFPKYRSGPVNGDKVSDESMSREKMKIDVTALLGGDIYATLRKRTDQAKQRFARERDESRVERAPALYEEAANADGRPDGSTCVAALAGRDQAARG